MLEGKLSIVCLLMIFTVGVTTVARHWTASAAESQLAFPDFGYLPGPGSYNGPVFKLSQNYPTAPPNKSGLPEFFKTDFKNDWYNYTMQVRDYCLDGNVEADWRVERNTLHPNRWYHMPWQHWGLAGREGIHGLTKEAPVAVGQLAYTQTYPDAVTWAVAIYNEYGGYTIGRVWNDHENPDLKETTYPKGFLNGTVVCKALFVSLPPDETSLKRQVPSLVNPLQWSAYVTPGYNRTDRSISKVTLIQMDIMIRDSRAPKGWLFGTFQYNGALNKRKKWENLVPVGLMWGDDPENNKDFFTMVPVKTPINSEIKESVINSNDSELPPTHLGWNGRLNGPVDNPRSSCFSCHSTAQYEAVSAITPFFEDKPPSVGSKEWMKWFRDLQCGEPFDKGELSADFSLQLAAAVANLQQWKATGGLGAAEYNSGPAAAAETRALDGGTAPEHKRIYPIVRNLPE